MSTNPFVADPAIAARHLELSTLIGPELEAELAGLVAARAHRTADNLGGIVASQEVARLVDSFALGSVEMLMLLALPVARRIALPPISQFFVGAVGLERETGNLILGGNVEFPGTHLGFTIHGEGFVFTRAASRGTSVAAIAIGEAHPCAHCRQYLSEFAASRDLILIDPLGHRLTMAELYPWPFDPAYLGEAGLVTGKGTLPELELVPNGLPPATAAASRAAGRRAHAPYSRCPGAVVLELRDGSLVSGFSIESVAFNPTMGPLQAAMIDLVAHGYAPTDIVAATLGTMRDGAVDYAASVGELLARLAPGVPLTTIGWA